MENSDVWMKNTPVQFAFKNDCTLYLIQESYYYTMTMSSNLKRMSAKWYNHYLFCFTTNFAEIKFWSCNHDGEESKVTFPDIDIVT